MQTGAQTEESNHWNFMRGVMGQGRACNIDYSFKSLKGQELHNSERKRDRISHISWVLLFQSPTTDSY